MAADGVRRKVIKTCLHRRSRHVFAAGRSVFTAGQDTCSLLAGVCSPPVKIRVRCWPECVHRRSRRVFAAGRSVFTAGQDTCSLLAGVCSPPITTRVRCWPDRRVFTAGQNTRIRRWPNDPAIGRPNADQYAAASLVSVNVTCDKWFDDGSY